MLRHEWEFEYTGQQLAEAALMQRDFRIERVRIWEDQKAAVIQRIRDSGINVSDALAVSMSRDSAKYMNTQSRRGAHITIDPTMQLDLDECVEKIREHIQLRNEYAAWYQVFTANPHSKHKLHHDDWTYFFLRSLGTEERSEHDQ